MTEDVGTFMRQVSPEPNCGCWIWTGRTNPQGYGRVYFKGTSGYAHRVAWELFRGPIPKRALVCHRCDVPECVNPDHLWIGSQRDNMADCKQKGRRAKDGMKGEIHPMARLTAAVVLSIRADPRSGKDAARHFGVSEATVSQIRNRRSWRHV